MNKEAKIYVAGHKGLAGSAIVRKLIYLGYENIVTRTHEELDLTNQCEVNEFFENEKPDYVFLTAARIGGISDKTRYPAEFIFNNLQIESNVISCAHKYRIKKLLFMGSSYAYPNECEQPIKEEYLLSGLPGELDEPYIIAKILGVKMCEYYKRQYGDNFISVMPCVFFGENDTFDLTKATVISSMIRRFHEAKINDEETFFIWGTGKPLREFLYVDDVADACVFLMENYDDLECINLGNGGEEVSIAEVADIIKKIVGFRNSVKFDISKPDGMYRKLLDSTKLFNMGWKPKIPLKEGILKTYNWYLKSR